MALPACLLVFTFLILPFFMAFGLSLTNQRLVSPNPTEFVGFDNFKQMLGVGFLVLEPEVEDTGEIKIDQDGNHIYPRVRNFTRNNEEFPQYYRKREWFRVGLPNDKKLIVLSQDVVFLKALFNTMLFALVVCPIQAGFALGLALLINQPLRGINIFRTIYFAPVVISMVVVSMLWRFIYDGQNGVAECLVSDV